MILPLIINILQLFIHNSIFSPIFIYYPYIVDSIFKKNTPPLKPHYITKNRQRLLIFLYRLLIFTFFEELISLMFYKLAGKKSLHKWLFSRRIILIIIVPWTRGGPLLNNGKTRLGQNPVSSQNLFSAPSIPQI